MSGIKNARGWGVIDEMRIATIARIAKIAEIERQTQNL